MRDQQLLATGYVAQQTVDQQTTMVNNDQFGGALRASQPAVGDNQPAGERHDQRRTASGQRRGGRVADARAAHAVVQQAQAAVQQLQTQIAKATIHSPIDGVVINRNLNPGEYPGARTLFTLQQLNNVYAELNASSADTFAIPVGAPVAMSVAGSSGRDRTPARVVAVLGAGDAGLDQLHRQGAGLESRRESCSPACR